MLCLRTRQIVIVLAALLAYSNQRAAAGVVVGTQLGDRIQTMAAGGAGTWKGFAFSERLTINRMPNPAPANQSSSWFTSPIAQGGMTLQSPVPLAMTPGGENVAIIFKVNGVEVSRYGPSVGAGRAKNLLRAPLESETVASASGGVGTEVHALADYNLTSPGFPNQPSVGSYNYTDHASVGGRAASIAFDPFTLAPGSYTYGGSNLVLNMEMALGGPDDVGDALFEAFDSRFIGGKLTGDDIIFGAPLWSLTIHADGTPLADKSNIVVDFQVNSAAVQAGAFSDSLTGPITAINAPAFVASINTNVKNALTVVDGMASLNNYELFASTLFYNVSGGSITYASGTGSGLFHIASVPEPSTIAMSGIAAVIGLLYARRRRVAGAKQQCTPVVRIGPESNCAGADRSAARACSPAASA
jgi:hypothetical protein